MSSRSPAKRNSSMIPTKPATKSVPSSPSRSRLAVSSSSRLFPSTTSIASTARAESDSDSESEEREKPRRKAGFGTPVKRKKMLDEEEDGKRENVVVCVRVRPSRHSASEQIYSFSPATGALALAPTHPVVHKRGTASVSSEYEFAFDALILPPSTSEVLYEDKIKPVVIASTKGFNGTVFAYGQTSSGKTHTMLGTPDEPGIIPLSIRQVFDAICGEPDRSFSLRVSLLEIYNETINDLLSSTTASAATAKKAALDVGSNGLVKGLTERAVSTPEQVMAIVEEGMENRRVGSTDWNERSSRGHCLFSLTIESLHKTTSEARTSKLHLIDLAGSESATAQEERRKEGAFINRSLLTLGTVISKLAERTNSHIPYRDSKLTRLLQPALSGNSRVAIIVAISPDLPQATETLSSLRFARRAKMIETKAERGVMVSDQILLKQYADQVERLKAQIREREDGTHTDDNDAVQARMDELRSANQQAQDELARKELELAALKTQLDQVNSLILTGASMESNARRRTSSSFAAMMTSPATARRTVSATSGIGLGTPTANRSFARLDRADSIASEMKRDAGHERELAAMRDALATANAQLDKLKSEAERESARFLAERTSYEAGLAKATEGYDALTAELTVARNDATEIRQQLATATERAARVDVLEAETATLRSEMTATRKELEGAKGDLQASELRLIQAEQRAEAADERAKTDTRDETIASLQREIAFAKKELQTVVTTKTSALASLKEHLATVEMERDVARRRVEEAEAKAASMAEINELNSREREMAMAQLRNETQAAISQAQAEVKRVLAELATKNDRIEQLERTIEQFKALEGQRSSSLALQKSSTDALRSRIADLQARSNVSSSLGSSQRSSTGNDSVTLVELQVRNGELVSRVADLEKLLSDRATADSVSDKLALAQVEERARLAEAVADEWKAKYFSTRRGARDSDSPDENSPPARSPSAAKRHDSTASSMMTMTTTGSPFGHSRKAGSISTTAFDKPPPLPYSPHQRDNKERKARRETIARDLAMLREKSAVERTKSALDSPSPASPVTSPRKEDDSWLLRTKKGSTDSAKMWS